MVTCTALDDPARITYIYIKSTRFCGSLVCGSICVERG